MPQAPRPADALEKWERETLLHTVGRVLGDSDRIGVYLRDDLEQELVIHWWRKRGGFRPDGPANKRTYMVTVLENKLRDLIDEQEAQRRQAMLRSQSVDQPSAEGTTLADILEDPSVDVADEVERAELVAEVRAWVHRLSPKDRATILALYQESTVAAAARRVGISRPAIYDRLAHLRRAAQDEGLERFL